jgi:hypothetical protein
MPTEKQYDLNNCRLIVHFDHRLVRIAGPNALQKFLSKDIETRSEVLVNAIKMDYLLLFDHELAVSNDSMIVEIWGHVYASYFAKAMKNLIKLKLVEGFADFIINRSDTIDCGEDEIDHNRKFWDILATFKGIILTFIPKRVK